MARIHVAKKSDFPAGTMRMVKPEGHDEILIANVDGNFYAMRGKCHHEGGPLWEGQLDRNTVTCPWHGAQWDVTTGKLIEFPLDLDPEPTYKVAVEGDDVYVEA